MIGMAGVGRGPSQQRQPGPVSASGSIVPDQSPVASLAADSPGAFSPMATGPRVANTAANS